MKDAKNKKGSATNRAKTNILDNISNYLTYKDIENYNPVWLINDLVLKNTLVSFYGMPGSGKSLTTLFLAINLLKNNAVKKVYYIDADNGYVTLKNRGLDRFLRKFPNLRYITTSKIDNNINTKTLIFDIAKRIKSGRESETLYIFDSIRNFIDGNMHKEHEVMPVLETLQKMRSYCAGVWFLNHQPKQSLSAGAENDKRYKGVTAFFDTPDELYFIQKRRYDKAGKQLIVTLEPMKKRDDTEPIAAIIDTISNNLRFENYKKYALSEKENLSLDYAIEIIEKSNKELCLSELITKIKERAHKDRADHEICGVNALKELLKDFEGYRYFIERTKNIRNTEKLVFRSTSGIQK